ncbi:MAG: phosphoribosylaminoimidazolesuccinocarboxamide synthase [Dehalococcoidia bacterium]|nr:phosphoribosylaminoimidazolesuccinocarboxamide synthase [Dehalococcoidia bacterium]
MHLIELITNTELSLPLLHRGKVRDTYLLGNLLLMIATDRVSAFDVILPNAIPNKGKVLNLMSAFWFDKTKSLIPNHVVAVVKSQATIGKYGGQKTYPAYLIDRSMIIKKAERLPVECVVRGYLAGSAWAEYQQSRTINSQPMPKGLQESQELPQPLFTPTTKADTGHDLPLTQQELKKLVGEKLAEDVKVKSLQVYSFAREYVAKRGIIIADTKFEFGLIDGKLALIDEILTPDSSRFWDVKLYQIGKSQPSFDKQPLRDWLVDSGWNKEPPAPNLPSDVVEATSQRYQEAYRRLTGKDLLG